MLQTVDIASPAPPTPPAPPAPPVGVIVDGNGQVITLGGDPAQALRGANARVDMLKGQLEELDERRGELVQEIRQLREQGIEYKGVEGRIASLDIQIQDVEKQLGEARTQAAQAAAVPGAIVEPDHGMPRDDGPPEGVVAMSIVFIVFVMAPVAFAYARRIWKRTGVAAAPALPANLDDRLKAIEQAVESTAVEVERIGEGQRFMSRLFTEQRALGEGAAKPVEVAHREKVPERR